MTCNDIQNAIWLGENVEASKGHIDACESCKSALNEFEFIKQSLSTKTPIPTKSLIPSDDMIKMVVKKNKSAKSKKWIATAVAAVLIIGIAIPTSLKFIGTNPSTTGSIVSASNLPLITVSSNSSDDGICKAYASYLKDYFKSHPSPIKSIVVEGFDANKGPYTSPEGESGHISFNVDFIDSSEEKSIIVDGDNSWGLKSNYNVGENSVFASFKKINGVWTVDKNNVPIQFSSPDTSQPVSITSLPNAGNSDVVNVTRSYLNKITFPINNIIKSVEIQKITLNGDINQASKTNAISGTLTMNVTLYDGKTNNFFKNGINTFPIQVRKPDGLFDVVIVSNDNLSATQSSSIPFSVLNLSDLPKDVFGEFDKDKSQYGIYKMTVGDSLYIMISNGYDPKLSNKANFLRVETVEHQNDKIHITASQYTPAQGQNGIPYTVIKIKNTNNPIEWNDLGVVK